MASISIIYDPEIILKIWEIFPEAFSVKKTSKIYDYAAGPWGMEEVETGEETIILAECIANTASAISNSGRDLDRALRFIESYKPAWIQRREIRNFLK